MQEALPKSYRNWHDAEWRRNYAREYSAKLYKEGRTWAQRNPDMVKTKRRSRTLKQYELTIDQWEKLFTKQGRACGICQTAKMPPLGWATDHDHLKGYVRGILCSACNVAIGQMKDNPEYLRNAADYLDAYQNKLRAYKRSK